MAKFKCSKFELMASFSAPSKVTICPALVIVENERLLTAMIACDQLRVLMQSYTNSTLLGWCSGAVLYSFALLSPVTTQPGRY